MESDRSRRNKRNILDASGRSNRRRLTSPKKIERLPGRRYDGAIAERSLPTCKIALTITTGTRNCAPTAKRQDRRSIDHASRTPDSRAGIPSETTCRFREINIRPKRDRPDRFRACDCRLQLRPRRHQAFRYRSWTRSLRRNLPAQYAGSINRHPALTRRGTRSRKETPAASLGASSGRRWLSHRNSRPTSPKAFSRKIKNDIESRDGRIGLRRFLVPYAKRTVA
jgi:hypothetical protein